MKSKTKFMSRCGGFGPIGFPRVSLVMIVALIGLFISSPLARAQGIVVNDVEFMPLPFEGDGGPPGVPRLRLIGENFPVGQPQDLCLVFEVNPLGGGPADTFPLTIVGVPTPDCLIAEIPGLPDGLDPRAGRLQLVPGQGVPVVFPNQPGSPFPLLPIQGFVGQPDPDFMVPPIPLPDLPQLPPPPPEVRKIFSRFNDKGELCILLEGSWTGRNLVSIAGDLQIKIGGPEKLNIVELNAPQIAFPPADEISDCAFALRQLIEQSIGAMLGARNIPVLIEVVDATTGDPIEPGDKAEQVKLILVGDPEQNAQICGGGFRICVRSAQGAPTVDSWTTNTPGELREDSVVKISGSGFGERDTDLVVILCTTRGPVPVRVLSRTDDCLMVRIGFIPPGAKLEEDAFKVLLGSGRSAPWVPAFPDVIPGSPVDFGTAPEFPDQVGPFADLFEGPPLLPLPQVLPDLIPSPLVPLRPSTTYLRGSVDGNGNLCIPLSTDWGKRPMISIAGTFAIMSCEREPADLPARLRGFIFVDRVRLSDMGGGTAEECAERLADVFRCTLEEPFEVAVTEGADGELKLVISIPGFKIVEPAVRLCVFRPQVVPPLVELEPLTPGNLGVDRLAKVGFNPQPEPPLPLPQDLCMLFGEVPMKLVGARGNALAGRLLPPLPGLPLQPLMIAPGLGAEGLMLPMFDDILVLDPVRFFVGDGVAPRTPDLPLPEIDRPDDQPDPDEPIYFVSEQVDRPERGTREICLYIDGEWCPGASVDFFGHLQKYTAEDRWESYDFHIPNVFFPNGGSLEDCVRRLKDLPNCGFDQISSIRNAFRWKCEGEDLDDDGKIDRVKLSACCPFFGFDPNCDPEDGDIPIGAVRGRMIVCLSNPPKDTPEIKKITSVGNPNGFPVCVKECDLLCIEACNVGCDPKDLCIQIQATNGEMIPLRVIEIVKGDDPDGTVKIIAQVGRPPGIGQQGGFIGRVCLMRGEGKCGIFLPNDRRIAEQNRATWVFDSQGNDPVYSTERIIVKTPPPRQGAREECFVGRSDQEQKAICVDVVGSWPAGTLVKLTGHLKVFNSDTVRGIDLSVPVTAPLAGNTAEDLTSQLKDVWRCALMQLSDVGFPILKCDDFNDNPLDSVFKICPPPGAKISGSVKITLCIPPTEPKIKLPDEKWVVCTGDVLCITGSNLPVGMPDKYCILIKDGATNEPLFPLEVLSAEPDPNDPDCQKLIVKVGVIPDNLAPGSCHGLGIGIGFGKRLAIQPVIDGVAADGLVASGNPALWQRYDDIVDICLEEVIEIGPRKLPPPRTKWVQADVSKGRFCLTIPTDEPWEPGKNVELRGHFILPQPFGSIDVNIPRVRLRDGGSPERCAAAIKDLLRCAFHQLDGFEFLQFECEVIDEGIKITIFWPNYDPEDPTTHIRGFLTFCCIDPPKVPKITDGPSKIETGGKYILNGECFDPDPDAHCIVFVCPDGTRVPIRVTDVSADGTEMKICVGPVPPRCHDKVGRIEMMVGEADVDAGDRLAFNVAGIEPLEPVWGWRAVGNNAAAVFGPVKACSVDPPDQQRWFFARVINGKLVLEIDGDWPENSSVRITARAHNECQRLDLEGPLVRFVGGGSAEECAAKLKDFLACAFRQQTGANVIVRCDPISGTNRVVIVICLENDKKIDWGLCTVCVVEGTSTPGDRDSDGLTDRREVELGTDPDNPDSDGDGLMDGEEVNELGTNPLLADTDCDGTSDFAEVRVMGTNPLVQNDGPCLTVVGLDGNTGRVRILLENAKRGQVIRLRERPGLGAPDILNEVIALDDSDLIFTVEYGGIALPDSSFYDACLEQLLIVDD